MCVKLSRHHLHCNDHLPREPQSASSRSHLFSSSTCSGRKPWYKLHMSQMPFLQPNQQCQCNEGNLQRWLIPHPFVTHHRQPAKLLREMGVAIRTSCPTPVTRMSLCMYRQSLTSYIEPVFKQLPHFIAYLNLLTFHTVY